MRGSATKLLGTLRAQQWAMQCDVQCHNVAAFIVRVSLRADRTISH